MMFTDWVSMLGPEIEVVYSSLHVNHKPVVGDDELALLRLPDGYGIDIEWADDEERYFVTMFRGRFENQERVATCRDYFEVISTVKRFYLDRHPDLSATSVFESAVSSTVDFTQDDANGSVSLESVAVHV